MWYELFLGISILQLVFSLPRLLGVARAYFNAGAIQVTDVTAEDRVVPDSCRVAAHELLGLGFQRFGEYTLQGPGTQRTQTVWRLFNPDTRTYVSLMAQPQVGASVSFTSSDGETLVSTAFPVGVNYRVPGYHAQRGSGTVTHSYHQHLGLVGQVLAGRVRTYTNMAEFLADDALLTERLGAKILRPYLFHHLAYNGIVLLMGLWAVGGMVVRRAENLELWMDLGYSALFLPLAVYWLLVTTRAQQLTGRDRIPAAPAQD